MAPLLSNGRRPLLIPGSAQRAIRRPDLRGLLVPQSSAAPLSGAEVDYDELDIVRSWRTYEPSAPSQVRYFCYELTQVRPGENAETFFKAVRMIRLTRVPRYLRNSGQSGGGEVFGAMRDVLVGLREKRVLFLNMIAKSPQLPLVFSYGVQATGDTLEEACSKADDAYAALSSSLDGTYQQLEYQPLSLSEGEHLARYQAEWNQIAMARGRPVSQGIALGSSAVLDGNRTDVENTNNQLEAFIRGMGDRSFMLNLITAPLSPEDMSAAWRNITKELSKARSDQQGSRGVSAGIALPLGTGMSMGDSSGITHGLTGTQGTGSSDGLNAAQTEGLSYTHTAGTNASVSDTATVSESHSVADSHAVATAQGQSVTASQSQTLTDGASRSDSASVGTSLSEGVTQGVSNAMQQGQSTNQGVSYSEGVSATSTQGVTASESASSSQGVSVGQSVSQSQGASTTQSQGISQGASLSNGTTAGQNWSQSAGQSVNAGQTMTNGFNQSLSESLSQAWNMNFGSNQGSSLGSNWGDSGQLNGGLLGFGSAVGESSGSSQGTNEGTNRGQGVTHTGGGSNTQGISNSLANTLGQTFNLGESLGGSLANSQTATNSVGQTLGQSVGQSLSATQSQSATQSASVGHTVGSSLSQSQSAGVSQSAGMTQGVGQSIAQTQGASLASSQGLGQSAGAGQSLGQSQALANAQGLSQGQSLTQSVSDGRTVSNGYTQGLSHGVTQGVSASDAKGISASSTAGASTAMSSQQALSDAYMVAASRSATTTGSLGVVPNIGAQINKATFNEGKRIVGDILEAQMKRYLDGIEGGGMLYQMSLVCPDRDTLLGASSLLKASFWGAGGDSKRLPSPFHTTIIEDPEEARRVLTHAAAFSSYLKREPSMHVIEPHMYSTFITTGEASTFCHPPTAEAIGLMANTDSMPVLAMPANREARDMYVGHIVNGERGRVSDQRFGVDLSELTHILIQGTTGSGKTTTMMRLLEQATRLAKTVVTTPTPSNPVVTSREVPAGVLALDWMQNFRDLANVVPADRFQLFSVASPELGAFRFNPLAVPHPSMDPAQWLGAQSDQLSASFGLGEFGRSLLSESLDELYRANRLRPYELRPARLAADGSGVVEAPAIILPAISRDDLPAGGVGFNEHGEEVANVYTCSDLSRLVGLPEVATIIARRISESSTQDAGRLQGTDIRNRLQSVWRRLQYYAPGGPGYQMVAADPSLSERECMGVTDLIDPDRGLVTVIETDGLDLENRRVVLGSVILAVYRYGLHAGKGAFDHGGKGPGTFVVLEEAHELFGEAADGEDRQSATMRAHLYESLFRRARATGLRLVAMTQNCGYVPTAITSMTTTVFAHRTYDDEDRKRLASLFGWERTSLGGGHLREFRYMTEIPKGYCVVRLDAQESYLESAPIQILVDPPALSPVTDEQLAALAAARR